MKKYVKIEKDGPIIINGRIPLYEKHIINNNGEYELKEIKKYELQDRYIICRCGGSENKPFCDGYHRKQFLSNDKKDYSTYADRSLKYFGKTIDLLDDNRCSNSRFCHKRGTTVWNLLKYSNEPDVQKDIILSTYQCLSGRLKAISKDGIVFENSYNNEISIIKDTEYNVNACVYIQGNIDIYDAYGKKIENKDKISICRCGKSKEIPFCDGTHLNVQKDK